MLNLRNIYKSFGEKSVIRGLSYSFEEGKIYSLSGTSGCGKSTLVELISGTENCTSGSIECGSVSVSFQAPNLLGCTALENVMLAVGKRSSGKKMKEYKKEMQKKAAELLGELGIENPELKPSEMSGGMQARVNLARALIRKSDVYLLDEPFAALDSASIGLAINAIKKHTANATVIAVIHDSVNCDNFADIRLKMQSGETTELVKM